MVELGHSLGVGRPVVLVSRYFPLPFVFFWYQMLPLDVIQFSSLLFFITLLLNQPSITSRGAPWLGLPGLNSFICYSALVVPTPLGFPRTLLYISLGVAIVLVYRGSKRATDRFGVVSSLLVVEGEINGGDLWLLCRNVGGERDR